MTTKTETNDGLTKQIEILDKAPALTRVVDVDSMDPDSISVMTTLGFPMPVASPERLRAAFAMRQRMFAAVLDPEDYLWTVSFSDTKNGRQAERQYVARNKAEAEERAVALGGTVAGKPKKNGIVKLARALGITAILEEVSGLPGDPHATYSAVRYRARHAPTGHEEVGVGFCDASERGGRISKHDIIATADTRAYNRAVLRLSGFGDVSAEEVVASNNASNDEPQLTHVPEPTVLHPLRALPGIDGDRVIAACRAWASAISDRNPRFAPAAQQDTRSAREMRAQSRRGEVKAATKLGLLGLTWDGYAQDGAGSQPFTVEAPPIGPEDIQAVASASAASTTASANINEALAASLKPSLPTSSTPGWDLSASGSSADDAAATPPASSDIPAPNPAVETITTKQAKNVSTLLLEILEKDRDKARAWLKTHCLADGAVHLRANQYEPIMTKLQQLKAEKAEKIPAPT